MKSTLEFNLPEEQDLLEAAIKGPYLEALVDIEIWNAVFRPAIKYGAYSDSYGAAQKRLNELLRDESTSEQTLEVIELLGEVFNHLVNQS